MVPVQREMTEWGITERAGNHREKSVRVVARVVISDGPSLHE